MKKFTVDKPFLHLNCGLAESPFWEAENNVLRFVDIVGMRVYRVNLDEGPESLQKQQYTSAICVTADIDGADDRFIFGGKYGFGIAKKNCDDTWRETPDIKRFWNEEEEKDGDISRYNKPDRMRANDGGVDTKGRFWSSALCDPEVENSFTPNGPSYLVTFTGVLFRLDLDGQLYRVITGLGIPNGMSFFKETQTLYFTDTSERSIYSYHYDEESGDLSSQSTFFRTEERSGPDGHAVDEEGNLWVAVWGAWKVVCVSPQGKVTAEITLPTRCITAVAFAGEDIYITSEKEKDPGNYPESVKYQGDVFTCHVGVKGRQANKAHSSYLKMA